jgi:hypothetical protein
VLVTALVGCVGVVAVVVAVRALRTVNALVPDVAPLRRAMLADDGAAIQVAVRRLFPSDADVDALEAALARSDARLAAVAALNDHLGDVDRTLLSSARELPRSVARIALSTGALGAALEIGSARAAPLGLRGAIAALLLGAISAGVVLEVGRRARAAEGLARAGWDEVSRIFSRRLA